MRPADSAPGLAARRRATGVAPVSTSSTAAEELARRLLGDGREHALTHARDDAADLSIRVVSQPGATRAIPGQRHGHVRAHRPRTPAPDAVSTKDVGIC